ncbi:hypothetical protein QBC32DRAFT_347370 [Pseudoneurospora amorphoporcata]|uniref:Heterokaryon incompatibility domain-containing protein n=1 Tax=Pseudoneurospora amorphoporcata TaxID=241081 RepID=A0AAN6NUM5_9PEZI|nr:hypothetical protein QBC32DRAFT_347370 [Pseudoneurospora amorphoporcata]
MATETGNHQVHEFVFSLQKYPVGPPQQPLALLELSPDTSKQLLSRTFDFEPKHSGEDLLNRIKHFDAWTADQLGFLDEALDKFLFKVLVNDPQVETSNSAKPSNPTRLIKEATSKPQKPVESFVALSYCWHYPEAWSLSLGLQHGDASIPDSPLAPAMFEAFLAERLSPEEPVWLDQWCIDQTNQEEKVVAIGAMDALYYSARVVVVCLEDVRLGPSDAEIIIKFAGCVERKEKLEGPDWEEKEQVRLWTAVERIFAARWFIRAWCAHEYWMAQKVVFLAPVTSDPRAPPGEVQEVEIVRFDNRFLQLVHAVASNWFSGENAETARRRERYRREAAKPMSAEAYYWGVQVPESYEEDPESYDKDPESKEEDQESFIKRRAFGIANNQHQMGDTEGKLLPQISSFAVIQSLAAGFERDKLSVWLNASRTRLFIKHNNPLSEAERAWIATIVSLASGDATVLAAVGSALGNQVEGRKWRETGWAYLPRVDDYVHLGSSPIYPALDGNPSLSPDGLALDAIVLDISLGLQSPHSTSMSAALGAIDWYLYQRRKSSSLPATEAPGEPGGWEDIDILNYSYRCHLSQALGILLELSDPPSFTWTRLCLSQAFPRPGSKYAKLLTHPSCVSFLDAGFHALSGARASLKAAVVFGDVDYDNSAYLRAVDDHLSTLHSQNPDLIFKGVTAFLAIAEGIVRTICGGAADYRRSEVCEWYKVQVSDAIPHGLIIFAPPPSRFRNSKFTIACPLALSQLREMQVSYMHRGWILKQEVGDETVQEHPEGRKIPRYILTGKTALFMPVGGSIIKHPETGQLCRMGDPVRYAASGIDREGERRMVRRIVVGGGRIEEATDLGVGREVREWQERRARRDAMLAPKMGILEWAVMIAFGAMLLGPWGW